MGGWTVLTVAKDAQGESWKAIPGSQGTKLKTGIVTRPQKSQLTLSQGMMMMMMR
jgi:hypothetical protein